MLRNNEVMQLMKTLGWGVFSKVLLTFLVCHLTALLFSRQHRTHEKPQDIKDPEINKKGV